MASMETTPQRLLRGQAHEIVLGAERITLLDISSAPVPEGLSGLRAYTSVSVSREVLQTVLRIDPPSEGLVFQVGGFWSRDSRESGWTLTTRHLTELVPVEGAVGDEPDERVVNLGTVILE